jgi:hypothetical protein
VTEFTALIIEAFNHYKEIQMETNMWNEADRLWNELGEQKPGTDPYNKVMEQIQALMDIQDTLLNRVEPPWYREILTSPVFIGGVIQLVATVVVVNHEQVGVITSKAFQWIRLR